MAGGTRADGSGAAAATVLATAFEQVGDWARPGTPSDPARFTVEMFARYVVHDPVHHLWDVTGMNRAR